MSTHQTVTVKGARVLLAILAACVPLTGAVSWMYGFHNAVPALALVASTALGAGLICRRREHEAVSVLVLGASVMALPIAVTMCASNSSYQIDMHMTFFVALALTTALCDWRAIIAGAAVAAVFHLGANFLMPSLVFPDGADFGRVMIHAVIVVAETLALIWLAEQLVSAFRASDAALRDAHAAQEEVERRAADDERKRERERAIEEKHAQEIDGLEQEVTQLSDSVTGVAQRVSEAFAELVHGAAGVRSGVKTIQERISLCSEAAAQVAAATEELSSSVDVVSSGAQASRAKSSSAEQSTQRVNAQVEQLQAGAAQIDNILKLISDIADQTNLLALNATIEAARAGDAGRGFAVVASEVKSLASQTGAATNDIVSQINEIQTIANDSAASMRTIAEAVGEASASVVSVAESAGEQRAAVREIAEQAQKSATESESVADDVSAVSQTADTIAHIADGMKPLIEDLRTIVDHVSAAQQRFRASRDQTIRSGAGERAA